MPATGNKSTPSFELSKSFIILYGPQIIHLNIFRRSDFHQQIPLPLSNRPGRVVNSHNAPGSNCT
ncbi:hypothetical protein CPB85DRAFT_1333961 [Mucidula mucida]|nr:hypothetical protein CPB85DRAFT_1333961 [Mucidula mucida]